MEIGEWIAIVNAAFEGARLAVRDNRGWWPVQRTGTVLAWAVALQTLQSRQETLASPNIWISASRGREWPAKRRLLRSYGVAVPRDGFEYAPDPGGARFSAREYLLDFTVWPSERAAADLILSMESECYSPSGVGARIEPENGFAYDYYRLMLVVSPLRLFVCRVNGDNARRRQLLTSLEQITQNARDTGALRAADEVSVLIVPAANADRANTIAAVWSNRGRRFIEQRLDPAIAQ